MNLRSLYVQGRKAPLTHAHYRRFAIQDIPLHDADSFDKWLYERWMEKEQLLEHFRAHGSFPAEESAVKAQVELRKHTGGFTLLSAKEIQPGVLVFRLHDQTDAATEALGTLQVRPGSSPPAIASFSLRSVP